MTPFAESVVLSRKEVFAGIFLSVVFLATFWDPVTLLVCKFFVDSISYGYSGAKTKLILLYLLGLIWLSRLPSLWRKDWNLRYVIALFILHAVAAANQLVYSQKFNLDPFRRTLLVTEGQFTSTGMLHIHAAKIPAAFVTRYSGEGFDSGSPFLQVFPLWWTALHTLFFLAVAVLSFLVVHERQKAWGWGKTLSLALSVFVLTKGGIDGGPFSDSVLAALPFVGGLLFGRRGARIGLALTVLGLVPHLTQGDAFMRTSRDVLGTACALSLPLLCDRSCRAAKGLRVVAAVACLAVVVGVPVHKFKSYRFFQKPPHALGTLVYGSTSVHPGDIVRVISPVDLTGRATDLVEIQGSIKGRRLAIYHLEVVRETTLFDISRQLEVPLFRLAVSIDPNPVQIEISGPFDLPPTNQWFNSDVIQSFDIQTSPNHTRLILTLVPGGSKNMAVDILPEGLFVCYEVRRLQEVEQAVPIQVR